MLSPVFENRFKKDIKRRQKRGKDLEKLKIVIEKLLYNEELESKYNDHALTGNWKGYRDCHIESDWILIDKISEKYLFFSSFRFTFRFILTMSLSHNEQDDFELIHGSGNIYQDFGDPDANVRQFKSRYSGKYYY